MNVKITAHRKHSRLLILPFPSFCYSSEALVPRNLTKFAYRQLPGDLQLQTESSLHCFLQGNRLEKGGGLKMMSSAIDTTKCSMACRGKDSQKVGGRSYLPLKVRWDCCRAYRVLLESIFRFFFSSLLIYYYVQYSSLAL